jgi:hypothetical protein
VGCNGKSALNHIFNEATGYDADINGADYDMISSIQMAIQQSPVCWSYQHVKGHQDDDGTRRLDWWARLNVEIDDLAKAFWADQVETAVVWNTVFPDEYWTFQI